jgi:ADP-ribosylglycohydrolase
MKRIPSKDQFRGCFVGQCLGDATGFPVEGYPPMICSRYVEQFLKAGLTGEWSHYPYPFGQYSDDSQMARDLIQSVLACRRFDPQDYAHRIATLFKNDKIVGQGQATQTAAAKLLQGIPWDRAGNLPPAAGNGSAMRVAPLGLLYYDDPKQMLQASHQQSLITHRDPRCSAGSAALAGAVALALQEQPVEANPFVAQLAKWASEFEPTVAENLLKLPGWLALEPEAAETEISRAGMEQEYESNWHGISPFVTSSLLWSLYSFLRTPDDYWATMCTAIAVGGDVDTTAAMAGAVSGAYLGLGAIPAHLAAKLTDQGVWGLEQLLNLIDQLFELKDRQ